MRNANTQAMPTIKHDVKCGLPLHITDSRGLTKREMFAMHAMQAWIQHHGSRGDYGFSEKEAAQSALRCADALLEELS